MGARTVAIVLLGTAILVVGVQLGSTDVGRPIGPNWSEPSEVASFPAGEDTSVTGVTADDGATRPAGDANRGAVAWVEHRESTWQLKAARFRVDGQRVQVGDTWTVTESDEALAGIDVARRGDRVAVVWERPAANVIRYRLHSQTATQTARVSRRGAHVSQPGVELSPSGPVVAWRSDRDGANNAYLGRVGNGTVVAKQVATGVDGVGTPALSTDGDAFAVAWRNRSSARVTVAMGDLAGGSVDVTAQHGLGLARSGGSLGGGSGTVYLAAERNQSTALTTWTDVGIVRLRAARQSGPQGPRTSFGPGTAPDIAIGEDRRLVAWIVESGQGSGADVAFSHERFDEVTTGLVSRLASSAGNARAVTTPHPVVVWSERGTNARVLASAYRQEPRSDPIARLLDYPAEFLFMALLTVAWAVFAVVISPWNLIAIAVAFLVTTEVVKSRVGRGLAWVATATGRDLTARDVRARLAGMPTLAWTTGYTVVLVSLTTMLLGEVTGTLPFELRAPIQTGAGAFVVLAAIVGATRIDSEWQQVVLVTYLYTAALWATALPAFL
jgi:hypothetical protein